MYVCHVCHACLAVGVMYVVCMYVCMYVYVHGFGALVYVFVCACMHYVCVFWLFLGMLRT